MIGLHFFSPVPVMKLVEVVVALDTADPTVTAAEAFASQIGKQPIRTKDRSGFIVNMLLVPYLMAAVRMYEDGFATREDIDEGMRLGCGHPMGPLTLCDFIGLDVLYAICDSLYEEFKRPEYAPAAAAQADGRLRPPRPQDRTRLLRLLSRARARRTTMAGPSATASGDFAIGGDLTVTRLGYGAMQLTGKGIWGEPADRGEAIRVLQRAVELGVTLIDTADSYGPYVAEEIIREALHPYADDVVIATKAGCCAPGPATGIRWGARSTCARNAR